MLNIKDPQFSIERSFSRRIIIEWGFIESIDYNILSRPKKWQFLSTFFTDILSNLEDGYQKNLVFLSTLPRNHTYVLPTG